MFSTASATVARHSLHVPSNAFQQVAYGRLGKAGPQSNITLKQKKCAGRTVSIELNTNTSLCGNLICENISLRD